MVASCRLSDLHDDALAAILGHQNLDTKSRLAAGAVCRALWRASCLPGVWTDLDLRVNLANAGQINSLLTFLTWRGVDVRRVALTTLGNTVPQGQLATLLGQLPALQKLTICSRDSSALRLHEVAAQLPRLKHLELKDAWGIPSRELLIPSALHLTGLATLTCLQCLELSSTRHRLQAAAAGTLLRDIEKLTRLTRLDLSVLHNSRAPSLRKGRGWSHHLSALQNLQEYRDGFGIPLPVEAARLPALRALAIHSFTWGRHGKALCATRGLHSLTALQTFDFFLQNYDYKGMPDPAGLQQALSTLVEVQWDMPVPELWSVSCFHLERLTCLELHNYQSGSALYERLLWSPTCRLQRLSIEGMPERSIDLTGLTPLTTLTYLKACTGNESVDDITVRLPQAPCMAHLRSLVLSEAGLTHIPVELSQADRLQLLWIGHNPYLTVDRAGAAILAGLRSLGYLDTTRTLRRSEEYEGWNMQSKRSFFEVLCQAKPGLLTPCALHGEPHKEYGELCSCKQRSVLA